MTKPVAGKGQNNCNLYNLKVEIQNKKATAAICQLFLIYKVKCRTTIRPNSPGVFISLG